MIRISVGRLEIVKLKYLILQIYYNNSYLNLIYLFEIPLKNTNNVGRYTVNRDKYIFVSACTKFILYALFYAGFLNY